MRQPVLIAILSCVIFSNLFSQVFENDDLKISVLEDLIWVIETTDNTAMYLVEGSDKALLIDTGTKCDSLDKIMRQITSKPVDVVITHGHRDHSGNIKYFDTIYMHPADTIFIDSSYKGVIKFVSEGDFFDLGNKVTEVYHMPGHTPGSIVLTDKHSKCCFTGDAFGSGLVWLQMRPYAYMQTYINSCSKMETLMDSGIEKIYCGHYPYLKKALYKDYIMNMKKLANAIYDDTAQGAKPYSIKVSISCDNPMEVWYNDVGIIYNPDHIKSK
ncbi:MAG: MBL fold metallo-hydrolase [Bacteroidales bacterium]|nr:MBL fold metallo-hydrolase [Bacteroidales bacterium]